MESKMILPLLCALASGFVSIFYSIYGIFTNTIPGFIIICIFWIIFLSSVFYLISRGFDAENSIKKKLTVIGDKAPLMCIGIIVLFFLFAFIGNMILDDDSGQGLRLDTHKGTVDLDHHKISFNLDSSIHEVGYWVYEDTGEPTGEVEYGGGATTHIFDDISFNCSKIKWEGDVDYDKFKQDLQTGKLSATVKLYNDQGQDVWGYKVTPTIKGDMVILKNSPNWQRTGEVYGYDEGSYAILYVTVDGNDKYSISSNEFYDLSY